MKLAEKIKLIYRANRYKNKDDKGGIQYILQTVRSGQTAFDIGAHKAGYLYFILQRVSKEGRVYAFEPQSTLYRYILSIKELFHWKNVTVEHLALSDTAGSTTLYIPSNRNRPSSPGATIMQPTAGRHSGSTEKVATETLDTYCRQHGIKPDFFKIDVEGNELPVLKGAIETLKKFKPKILVECEARHVGRERVLETFQFMKGLGYKGSFIMDRSFLPLDSFDFDIHQKPGSQFYCNNFIFE